MEAHEEFKEKDDFDESDIRDLYAKIIVKKSDKNIEKKVLHENEEFDKLLKNFIEKKTSSDSGNIASTVPPGENSDTLEKNDDSRSDSATQDLHSKDKVMNTQDRHSKDKVMNFLVYEVLSKFS